MSIGVGDGDVAQKVVPTARHATVGGIPPQAGSRFDTHQQPRVIRTRGSQDVDSLGALVRRWGLHAEIALCASAAFAALVALDHVATVDTLIVLLWGVGNFHQGRSLTSPLDRQLRSVLRCTLLPLATIAFLVGYLGADPALARAAFAAVLSATVVSLASRVARWRLCSPTRVVAIGDRVDIAQVAQRWQGSNRVEVVGALLLEPGLEQAQVPAGILDVPVVAGTADAEEWVKMWSADLVAVGLGPGFSGNDFRRLSWQLERTRVSLGVVEVLDAVSPHRINPGLLDGSSVLDVRVPRPSTFLRGVKHSVDRVGAVLGLVVLSPLLLAIAASIVLTSRGPALFRQVRVGQNGREFKVIKFRTMIKDADAIKGDLEDANEFGSVLFKMKADPRITRVGRFLRRSSLDELPQLVNVLRGEMSLVGPRPHLPSEIQQMEENTLRRLAVRPGITGLWQVSGRSDLAFEQAAALDTFYADNWSLGGDLHIALRTIKAVLTAKGAY
jgi:exopolysaccharide biosynthesis polyprenyl glycosylphosphotransferase